MSQKTNVRHAPPTASAMPWLTRLRAHLRRHGARRSLHGRTTPSSGFSRRPPPANWKQEDPERVAAHPDGQCGLSLLLASGVAPGTWVFSTGRPCDIVWRPWRLSRSNPVGRMMLFSSSSTVTGGKKIARSGQASMSKKERSVRSTAGPSGSTTSTPPHSQPRPDFVQRTPVDIPEDKQQRIAELADIPIVDWSAVQQLVPRCRHRGGGCAVSQGDYRARPAEIIELLHPGVVGRRPKEVQIDAVHALIFGQSGVLMIARTGEGRRA